MINLFREGYTSLSGIVGPLLFLKGVRQPGFAELVSIETPSGVRTGQILQVDDDLCIVQVFDGTMGMDIGKSTVWLERDIVRVPAGEALIGQILDGRGRRIDGKTMGYIEKLLPTSGMPINPVWRQSPSSYIETGISTIDMMNTLVKGQKLPIFSGAGLPANQLAAQIVSQARVPGSDSDFLVIFAAMGITQREADFFIDTFRSTGAIDNGIFFLNLASDSAAERLLTPRMALSVAEYFAFEKNYDVLVVMTDMLYYSEALREISAAREEVPGRRGYPGYTYSDLATLYERAGCIRGASGSITQIPIITMPDDDMTHPVVDLSGYITEGQVVLDRSMHDRGLYPPINVLPSLSRLMNKGIGKRKTFEFHRNMADQLYSSYARAQELERLRLIVGDDGLTDTEKLYLAFGREFETRFVNQGSDYRTMDATSHEAWECLKQLPNTELYRLPPFYIAENLGSGRENS